MKPDYYVFNGDADGLFAAHQIRLQRGDAPAVTGVKRDIQLLERLQDQSDQGIVVCDISLDKNRLPLEKMLGQGCQIEWYDHHHAGEIPAHPGLQTRIDQAATVNSSSIVYQALATGDPRWAIAGLFGDNMADSAMKLAQAHQIPTKEREGLQELGQLLNYNAYGASLEDLIFDPSQIFAQMERMQSPTELLQEGSMIPKLRATYKEDLAQAEGKEELQSGVLILPDKPWAGRIVGDFAYRFQARYPGKAVAILLERADGSFQASLRVPAEHQIGAADFCMRFPTGGGRKTAAGINRLGPDQLEGFLKEFQTSYH